MGKIAAYYYQGGVTPLTTQVTVPVRKVAENSGFGWLSWVFESPLQIELSEYACQGQVWLRVCQAAGTLATDLLPHGSHDLLYSYALSGSFAKRDQISFQALVLFPSSWFEFVWVWEDFLIQVHQKRPLAYRCLERYQLWLHEDNPMLTFSGMTQSRYRKLSFRMTRASRPMTPNDTCKPSAMTPLCLLHISLDNTSITILESL